MMQRKAAGKAAVPDRKKDTGVEGAGKKWDAAPREPKKIKGKYPVQASDARTAAWMVLSALEKESWTLDVALERFSDRFRLTPRDQALFHAICHGVLRWRQSLDAAIVPFSRRPLDRMGPDVLTVLRIALFQIRYLDKIPVSAAVDTAVELTRRISRPRAAGFVNAVLRAAAKPPSGDTFPDPEKDPLKRLAQSRSFPVWLVSRWAARMGLEKAAAFCDAQNEIPPITVRANRLKVSRARLLAALKEESENIRPCRYAPDGVSFFNPRRPVPEMIPFKRGWFQVQDEAAQLVTLLLDPRPGETVLDACAGRGGKTGHMAQQMENKGRIVAWDVDAKKLSNLVSEMQRLGVTRVRVEKRNLQSPGGFDPKLRVDRVLLDAPCSGLGVLRRNPDARWRVRETDLSRHREKQLRLLSHSSTLVKPSGVLVYAVCSTEPEETEAVVEAFLKAHPDFSLCADEVSLPDALRLLLQRGPYLKTSPLDHGMDGFFAARLERRS